MTTPNDAGRDFGYPIVRRLYLPNGTAMFVILRLDVGESWIQSLIRQQVIRFIAGKSASMDRGIANNINAG